MSSGTIATTPRPPYYAAIFTSIRTGGDLGYGEAAERMVELAAQQPGFLGVESVRDATGLGVTVSYWETEDAIRQWKTNAEHLAAQEKGRATWYAGYHLRIARVEREYGKPERRDDSVT
jgi:heme-degrading monooxygenase HmoA